METSTKQRAAGFVKNKLLSSFYKTTKQPPPPPPLPTTIPYGVNKPNHPSSSMKKVPSLTNCSSVCWDGDLNE
ncbi:hypothetical protein L1987_42639 [Smallanthus sonchifolius]|uniref:Uncharacterized protein n=1 Tax=Smallanthus sonchifolius TaxID=185202 RepID=A0ACB9GJC3_9ASTR|nr:hypothetical protein L1987_42639 [Smallanthus sonchifolius]